MTQDRIPEYCFTLTGGLLCLDFANTLDDRPTDQPIELLNHYSDLVSWSQQTSIITSQVLHYLVRQARRHPGEATAILEQAMTLREAIYRMFSAIVGGRVPEATDLGILNTALTPALARSQIIQTTAGFEWGWVVDTGALDQVVWPVARSAADLLTSNELAAVRECAGYDCGWLFMDRSRAHRRRWCDMKICGNREKARRHYQRTKSTC